MKKDLITTGKTYENNGLQRKVIELGDSVGQIHHRNQIDKMTVVYEIVKGRGAGRGTRHTMTLARFATWAKKEVA